MLAVTEDDVGFPLHLVDLEHERIATTLWARGRLLAIITDGTAKLGGRSGLGDLPFGMSARWTGRRHSDFGRLLRDSDPNYRYPCRASVRKCMKFTAVESD